MIDILSAAMVTRLETKAPPALPQPNVSDLVRLAVLLGLILAALAYSILQ